MAALMDGELRKSLLDRTDSEKAFRPWWDTLEDTLLNTLIALGKNVIFFHLKNDNFDQVFCISMVQFPVIFNRNNCLIY